MYLRSVLVESFPFAPVGVSLSDDEIDRKKSELFEDFLVNCPCARYLTSSNLVTAQWTTIRGLDLQFWLAENDQMSLPLPTRRDTERQIGHSDGFAVEVSAVKADLAEARRRFNWAVSPIRNVAELRDATESGVQIRELRTRTKLQRPLYVTGTPFQPTLTEISAPAYQAQGIAARIQAKVLNLSKGLASLQDITLLDPICSDLVGAIFPRTMGMTRPRADQNLIICNALMTAVDRGSRLVLDVVVCLDWVSAQPASLHLTRIAFP